VSNDDNSSLAPPKKSKLGLILGIVGGVLVLVAGTAAGLILGPSLFGGPPAAAAEASPGGGHAAPAAAEHAAPKAEKSEHGAPEKIVAATFEPLIVDVMDEQGVAHHVKVGLSAELAEGVTVDDFKLLMPRGREAAISYLRSLTFEEVTSPKKYGRLKKELTRNVTKALGESKLHRLLIVDFVAQ
jgi:flagellar basal body-associated protein FliL